jgi:nickel/cobalt exporter
VSILSQILQPQGAYSWLFVPSAVLLGALHGLEPGHAKTMMAAFIIAIRGTVRQAVMLGVAATISHTAVVWVVAMIGLKVGQSWNRDAIEPYMQLISAAVILLVALWMAWRAWRHLRAHDDEHEDEHEREHAGEMRRHLEAGPVGNGRILLFGLTGGLIPCPASITVLMLCLQLKQAALGAALVLCFSIGLAVTLVASGVLAALGARHVVGRLSRFRHFAEQAPLLSAGLMVLVAGYMAMHGIAGLRAQTL